MRSNHHLRKLSNLISVILLALLVSGCGSDGSVPDMGEADAAQTVQNTWEVEQDPFAGEKIEPEAINGYIAADEVTASLDAVTIQGCERTYDAIEEMFRETDPNWNTSDDYTEAIAAYAGVLNDINTSEMDFETDEMHIEAAYIDSDDVPELLVSYGNYHMCGVHVYRYDPAEGRATHLGEFGSFGVMGYYDKSSLIECYYGNMGCYTYYLSEMNGNEVKLKDSWLIDGSGIVTEEIRYYHGYFIPDMYNGSREDFENNQTNELFLNFEVDDSHQISEEEFNSELTNWIGCPEEIFMNVSYDEMYGIKS